MSHPTKKGQKFSFLDMILSVFSFVGNSGKEYNTYDKAKRNESYISIKNTKGGQTRLKSSKKL